MDYLQQVVRDRMKGQKRIRNPRYIRFDQLFERDRYDVHKVAYSQVNRLKALVENTKSEITAIWCSHPQGEPLSERLLHQMNLIREDCAQYVGRLKICYSTMVYLLMCLEREDYRSISKTMFSLLFSYPNTAFFSAIRVSSTPLNVFVDAEPDEECVEVYGMRLKKVQTPRIPVPAIE